MVVGAKPEVQAWIKDLRRLIKRMPPDIRLFVESEINVMVLDADGDPFISKDEGEIQEAAITSVTAPRRSQCDGGAW